MTKSFTIRFRVDFGVQCSVGIGKIELLEAIHRTGSLSQAARALDMSYRRAWLLMADLNASFDQPVVDTMTGGSHGGGAVLTDFGCQLVAGYRQLETSLKPIARRCLRAVRKRVAAGRVRPSVRPRLVKRRAAAQAAGG